MPCRTGRSLLLEPSTGFPPEFPCQPPFGSVSVFKTFPNLSRRIEFFLSVTPNYRKLVHLSSSLLRVIPYYKNSHPWPQASHLPCRYSFEAWQVLKSQECRSSLSLLFKRSPDAPPPETATFFLGVFFSLVLGDPSDPPLQPPECWHPPS